MGLIQTVQLVRLLSHRTAYHSSMTSTDAPPPTSQDHNSGHNHSISSESARIPEVRAANTRMMAVFAASFSPVDEPARMHAQSEIVRLSSLALPERFAGPPRKWFHLSRPDEDKFADIFLTQQRFSLHTLHERKGEELIGNVEVVAESPLQIRLPEKLVIVSYSREPAVLRAEAHPTYPDLKPHKVRLRAMDEAAKLKGLRDFLCERSKAGISNFELGSTRCSCTLLPEKIAQPNEIMAVLYLPQTGQKRQREHSDQEESESVATKRRLDETRVKHVSNHAEEGSAIRVRSSGFGEHDQREEDDSRHESQGRAVSSDEYEEYLKPGSYEKYLGSVSGDMRRKIEGKKEFFFKQLTREPNGRSLLRDIWMDEEVGVFVDMHTHIVRVDR